MLFANGMRNESCVQTSRAFLNSGVDDKEDLHDLGDQVRVVEVIRSANQSQEES